jgi:D-alanyl-D-alanine carboxypeptidase
VTNRLTIAIGYAALVLSLAGCGGGSSSPAQASLSSTVTSIVNRSYRTYGLPSVSIAIARHGVPIYSYSVGYADLSQQIPASPETIYQIGSLSKQFTTTAILQLANASPPLLSVDDAIDSYFDFDPNFDPRITIAEMATNTSGLADYINLPQFGEWAQDGVDEDTLMEAVIAEDLLFDPGTFYSYSNSNFFVLAALAEERTGEDFEDYLTDNILVPAGLDSTFFYLAPSDNAVGYSGLNVNNPEPRLPASTLLGAGSMSSTVLDLCKWDWELLGGNILPPAVITQMITPPDVPQYANPSVKSFYAYGLGNILRFGRTEIFHSGEVPGFRSTTATFLDTGWSIAILVNNDSFDIDELRIQIENAVCSPHSALRASC